MEIRNRAAYMVTPGKMEIRELPMPQAQPGEVVLKIEYVGVCGSDAHFFESGMRKGKAFDLPFILGHECAGTVTQVVVLLAFLFFSLFCLLSWGQQIFSGDYSYTCEVFLFLCF